MLLLGCKPESRHTEQHDVFFGIADSLQSLLPDIINFWPEANGKIHIDGWREVTMVNGWSVEVVAREETHLTNTSHLFFINLGGYKEHEMEEFHYKMLVAGVDKNEAIKKAKATAFFKHTGFEGATSHIDDKYGVDVDDLALVQDILPSSVKDHYALSLNPASPGTAEDPLHLGYFKLEDIRLGKYP